VETNGVAESQIVALAQPERLQRELARAFKGVARGDAFVAFQCGAQVASACIRDADSCPARAPIDIGCVAKLLTATLARRAFNGGSLAPEDDAGEALSGSTVGRALRGITVRQLLDHTHGLDDSRIAVVPRRSDTRIDVDALVRAVRGAPALAPPGAIYSYGSAGAWLVAALLERVGGRPYSDQVREGIFAPLGIREHGPRSAAPICPATGAALALDPADVLRFVAHAALEDPATWPDEDRAGTLGSVSYFPGWSPLERGVHLGWKYHGRGWFGHQSVWSSASLLVRAQPRRALAFVVASREHSAAVVAARVFGPLAPELFDLRIPARPSVVQAGQHVGAFGSAAWRVAIHGRDDGLELRVRRRSERGVRRASLHHRAGGVLFTRPTIESFPHVEVVTPDSESAYLWNGRFVLRRDSRGRRPRA
jgi:CubicO group peptidase (beta-lactamase class C family)